MNWKKTIARNTNADKRRNCPVPRRGRFETFAHFVSARFDGRSCDATAEGQATRRPACVYVREVLPAARVRRKPFPFFSLSLSGDCELSLIACCYCCDACWRWLEINSPRHVFFLIHEALERFRKLGYGCPNYGTTGAASLEHLPAFFVL